MPEQMREKKHASKPPKSLHGLATKRPAPMHPLLSIQQSLGNKACLRLRRSLGVLQTKLSLGQPNDLYEQEADTVASQIVNQMSKVDQSTPDAGAEVSHQVQRQEEEELAMPRRSEAIQLQPLEEEEEEEMIQPRRTEIIQRQEEQEEELQTRRLDTIQRQEEEELAMPRESEDRSGSLVEGPVPHALEHQVEQAQQGGDGLNTTIRSQMESGFGYDFQNVHIHNDSASDNLSRQLSAEAFTLNNDIFFRSGRYDPSSTKGQNLLAHELTHVVQQGAAPSHNANPMTDSTGGI